MTRLLHFFYSLLLIIGLSSLLSAQSSSSITLEDLFHTRKFNSRDLTGLRSMKDGLHYTLQNGTKIEKYNYREGVKTATLLDISEIDEISQFSAYSLNDSEDKILLETGLERIYRHSYRASYYVYDKSTGELSPVSKKGKQQLGTFSPTGSNVAFVRDNNLFIRNFSMEEEVQVTFDGVRNEIINGIPDWVYEEEFGFSQGFQWSPDGRKIAFYRFDERNVPEFHMTMFGDLYPESYQFKYPKAGEDNSLVTIHVYDVESGKTVSMEIGEETDQYIPLIKWTNNPEVLCIMRLNRLQNKLDILHANLRAGESKVVYSEENKYYISEVSDNTITYLPDGESFILNSEIDGYFHLHHFNFINGQIRTITSGDYDISTYMGYDEKQERLYYSSHEESSIETHVYSIKLDGSKKQKLSTQAGTNLASFSSSYKYYILTQSSANAPPYITLHNQKGKLIRVLEDNNKLKSTVTKYGYTKTEFLSVPTRNGLDLNAWMIKPANFNPDKEYPLFIFVYGGPESQKVTNSWGQRVGWFQYLSQQGYIIACVDNRGTNGRGEEFRKSTYMQLGKLETIDQLDAAKWFGSQVYIDAKRIGIFGWSYGAYMTSLCMTKGYGMYKMGIAVAPVTSWRYYDSIYSERFMRTPQENPRGYDDNSPIKFADGLQGKLLLIHGSGDDNVHFQNTIDFAEALVQADKQFEMQVYPNRNHGIYGGNTTFHLYTRMTNFILENL